MKKTYLLVFFVLSAAIGFSQAAPSYDPVTLMLAFQKQYAGHARYSGLVKWQRQNGESFAGRFVVQGERYHLTWQDAEIRCDGFYEWEILHRSKRIKKHFYDPLLAPAVVNLFRLVRLNLEAEVVRVGGSVDKIALDIDFGSSVAQGSHYLFIDKKTLSPTKLVLQVDQESFYESAEFAEIKMGEDAAKGEFSLEPSDWKAKGYSITDMAKGESDAVWPEERALLPD